MKLTYHELRTGAAKKYAGRTFMRMEQKIDCIRQVGIDYEEVKLFGFSSTASESSILRSLLYELPHHLKVQDFLEILDSYPNSRIVRQISHEPVISPAEREFIKSGLIRMEQIARRQIVRDRGSIYIDRYGMAVYAQNKLSLTGEYQDQDYRITVGNAMVSSGTIITDIPVYTTQPDDDE